MRYLRKRKRALVALSLLAALILSACTGDSSGNSSGTLSGVSLSPLVVADRVSVVDPESGGGTPVAPTGIKSLLLGILTTDLPPASDYMNDRTSVYVNERSVEAFNTVNDILCQVKQTAYDAMVNKGPYLALIDENACSSARSDASSSGQSTQDQSSSAAITQYVTWTVDSSRMSATSPHIVRIWFRQVVPGIIDLTILLRVVITESVSVAPPYGIFKIDFKVIDTQNPLNIWFKGFLHAERDPGTPGKILLKYATERESADDTQIEKATLDKSPDGASGSGSVLKVEAYRNSTSKTDRFDIAYNSDLFLRLDFDNNKICLDRKTVDVSAWRYGLYDKVTGNRRNLNTGFTITKDGQFGWIGYWGVWLPTGVTLAPGDTVYQHDYSTGNDTPYTVFQAGGKLKKHTKHSMMLNDIKNVPMDWWDSAAMKSTRVVWNETSSQLEKVAEFTNDLWTTLPSPVPLDLSALPRTELYFWSQSIGGSVRVKLTGCTTTYPYSCGIQNGSTPDQVVYYTEDIVYPNDGTVPPTLACFWNCPDAVNLSTASPFKANSTVTNPIPKAPSTLVPGVDYASYTFDITSNVLMDGTNAVTTTAPDPAYEWGIRSGELFAPTTANLNALVCDWDITGLSTCGWQAGSVLDEFYTWETGKDSWNQFIALRDTAGAIVQFEKPLQVTYLHKQPDTSALDYKYDNVKFFLEYGGFGDLRGIPSICINLDDGTTANCADSATNSSIRWVPEFTIPDKDPTSLVGDLTEVTDQQSGISYIVKALEKEERMRGISDTTVCTDALTASPYSLPDMSFWDDPIIGRQPVITSAPRVIGGVVQ